MSDPFQPGVIEALEAQARWRRDKERLEASLTERERAIRAKFEKAMGPDGPPELAGFDVVDPTSLLVYAEAYRQAGRDARWKAEEARLLRKNAKLDPGVRKTLPPLPTPEAAEHPYKVAMYLCVAVWLALRGHAGAEAMLAERRSYPRLPPVPKDWRSDREAIYAAMGVELPPEGPKVVPLFGVSRSC